MGNPPLPPPCPCVGTVHFSLTHLHTDSVGTITVFLLFSADVGTQGLSLSTAKRRGTTSAPSAHDACSVTRYFQCIYRSTVYIRH